MNHLSNIKVTFRKTFDFSKTILAVSLTLAFGITMAWGISSSFREDNPGALAQDTFLTSKPYDYSTSTTFATTMAASQTCHEVGDTWNECCGNCTSKKVTCTAAAYDASIGCNVCWQWDVGECNQYDKTCGSNCEDQRPTPATSITFYCNELDYDYPDGIGRCERHAIAVKENGQWCGAPLPLPEICYAWQKDDYAKDAPGCGVADWNSYISPSVISAGDPNHPSCQPVITRNVTGEAYCQDAGGQKYTLGNQSFTIIRNRLGDINVNTNGFNVDLTGETGFAVRLNGNRPPTTGTLPTGQPYSKMVGPTLVAKNYCQVGNNYEMCNAEATANHVNFNFVYTNCTPPPEPTYSCDVKRADVATTTSVKLGDIITYYIDYSFANLSEPLIIVDELPDGVTITGLDDITGGTNCGIASSYGNKMTLSCEATNAKTLSFKVKVNEDYDGDKITNYAYVVYKNQLDKKEECNYLSHNILKPDFGCNTKIASVTKDAKPGDEITYNVDYFSKNIPSGTQVIVKDKIPNGTRWDSQNSTVTLNPSNAGSCSYIANDNEIRCLVTKSGVMTFNVFVKDDFDGEYINNTAEVIYREGKDTCSAKTKMFVPQPAVECISKEATAKKDLKVGDTVKFTINYTSENQKDLINIHDYLDKNSFSFIKYEDGSDKFCEPVTDGNINCKVKQNEDGSISFSAKILKSGVLENSAVVADSNENQDICKVEVSARDLIKKLTCVTKTADENHRDIGDKVDFTIKYKNTGEYTLQGFEIVDNLPVGMTFIESKNHECSIMDGYVGNGQMIGCSSDATLKKGEEATFNILVEINKHAPVGKTIVNKITHLSSLDRELIGDVENCTEKIYINLPKPTVKVEKLTIQPSDRTLILGDDAETMEDHVKFKITVTNTGPTKLVIVPLKDTFNTNDYKFISATPTQTTVTTNNSTAIIYWENIGEIEVGSSIELFVTLQALDTYWDDVNENVLPNYVKVEGVIDENGVEANEDQDQDHVVVLGSILGKELEFSIDKSLLSENPTSKDKLVIFKIRVTNTGEKEITSIRLIDSYDVNYLTYTRFSNNISQHQNIYSVDASNGRFIHENILDGKNPLQPNDFIEFEIHFTAKNKSGETTNLAKAIVEDIEREDDAKVRIVVEILAKTGSNIVIPVIAGIVLTMLLGGKFMLKRKNS